MPMMASFVFRAKHVFMLIALVLTYTIVLKATQLPGWIHDTPRVHLLLVLACLLLAAAVQAALVNRPRAVYLVNYACFLPAPEWKSPNSAFIEHVRLMPFFDDRSVRFMEKMLGHSGIGDETSLPPGLRYIPPCNDFRKAHAEAELVIFTAVDELLAKTGVSPDAVGIVVINCSAFAPVPSLSDMIVRRYELRSDIRSVNLSGMGCSAGLISVELAAGLLQAAPRGSHALVVSTETITPNYYHGKEPSMLLSNALFRVGGAAILMSTSSDRARFRLAHVVRTITGGANDNSYRCIFQQEDAEGIICWN